eukprot:m.85401 g.85401  ORF g.85401 m.85401 type:complete len:92 (+) comp14844_c2_seq1:144-419(+)
MPRDADQQREGVTDVCPAAQTTTTPHTNMILFFFLKRSEIKNKSRHQHKTRKHNTTHHSTAQHNTAQHNTTQRHATPRNTTHTGSVSFLLR